MLEQRRAQKQGYLTLKEAAKLAGYSSDYIGQLIRAGKIRGEQVYSGVAWMTTKDEIQAYLDDKSRSVSTKNDADINLLVANLRFKLQKYATVIFVVLFGLAILGMQYAIYTALVAETTNFNDEHLAQSILYE